MNQTAVTIKKIWKVLLPGMILLLTVSISSGQVALVQKSTILPDQSQRSIVGFTAAYAQNTQTGETLIIWYESNSDGTNKTINGRIVDGKGGVVGKEFTIISKPQKPTYEIKDWDRTTIDYNPIKNEYLLTLIELTGVYDKILALRLAADGSTKGKEINLTKETKPFSRNLILLKFNPVTGGYLQFSVRHTLPAATTTVQFVDLLNAKGKRAQPPVMLDSVFVYENDDFTFLPSGKILISRRRFVSDNQPTLGMDYQIATVDPLKKKELTNLKPEDFTFISRTTSIVSGYEGMTLALPSADSPILYFTDDKIAKGQEISADGKTSTRSFSALNSPVKSKQLFVSTAAFSSTSRGVVGLLIALDDPGYPNGPVTIWAQPLDSKGKPAGSPKKLYKTSGNERIDTNKLFALPVQPGDSVARFVWYGMKGDYFNNNYSILKLNLSLRLR